MRPPPLDPPLRYIDDVHSLNNAKLGYVFYHIYPIELEIHDTTDTPRSASYLDILLEIDSKYRFLRRTLYNKRDDFDVPIVNFPFIGSNIPAAVAHGVLVYISQLRQYCMACGSYHDSIEHLSSSPVLVW